MSDLVVEDGSVKNDPFSRFGLLWRAALLVLIATLVRFDSFAPRLSGAHCFRQAQTASITRCIAEGKGSFLHPTSDLGMPNDPIAVEAPVYQAILGGLCRYVGYSETVLRVFSVFCGLVTGLALALLVHTLTANRTASWLCAAFYFGAILPAFFHATPMPDNLILAIVAVALYLFARAATSDGGRFYYGAFFAGAFAIGLKPPLCVGLVFVAWYLLHRKLSPLRAARFILMMILAGGLMAVTWGAWANSISKGTYFAFIFDPKFSFEWNFGWGRLILPRFYALSIARCIQQNSLIALPLILLACLRRRGNGHRVLVLVWLAGEIAGFLVFPNLNYIHNYYQLRLALFSAVAGALGWMVLRDAVSPRFHRFVVRSYLVTGIGLVSVLSPLTLLSRHQTIPDEFVQIYLAADKVRTLPKPRIAAAIDRFTWDFSFPYAAHRQIFLITQFKIGSVNYNNFDAFAAALIDDVYVIGNPWVPEGRMHYADAAFAAKVHDYLNENYSLKEESGPLQHYMRKHP